jgi:hypothetical protein
MLRRWLLVLFVSASVALIAAAGVADGDQDGIDDQLEDALAERFAPVVHHQRSETNYPVNVDWLLARTSLREYDERLAGGREVAGPVSSQAALLARTTAHDGRTVTSDGTRSVCKESGYFLADVDKASRAGLREDPRRWTTYVHAYDNVGGGVTIQYWRLYAYDETRVLWIDWGHGGDWEGIAVHLDRTHQPETVGLLGHTGIERLAAREMTWEGTHPLIWSEAGGHASRKAGARSAMEVTRQETWTAGGGGLVNVGEKSRPRNGQVFVQYSGLWGAPHRWFVTSGYWGPAFNETGAVCDNGRSAYRISLRCGAESACPRIVHTAWCDRMDGGRLNLARECSAATSAP